LEFIGETAEIELVNLSSFVFLWILRDFNFLARQAT